MTKYRALYERYRGLIQDGDYGPGERLPSLRAVAEAEGLGLNTVRAAFDLLSAEGLARASERGGYFASRPASPWSALSGCVAAPDCRYAHPDGQEGRAEYRADEAEDDIDPGSSHFSPWGRV